jgi:hypothetical protein
MTVWHRFMIAAWAAPFMFAGYGAIAFCSVLEDCYDYTSGVEL